MWADREGLYRTADLTHSSQKSLLSNCDVVVDGPFQQDLADMTLKWCGSSNQRVIDVKRTLGNNEIILYEK